MSIRRIEWLILFIVVLALNWVGTLWWLSGHAFTPAWASGQAQAVTQSAAVVQANAAIPSTFSYQGTLRDVNGNLVNNTVKLTIGLYNVVTGGTALYAESFTNVNVRAGLFSVVVGDTVPIPTNIFTNFPLYLGITVDTDPEMLPRQRLHPVPWAMQATTAQTAVTANNLVQGGGVAGLITFGANGAKQIGFPDGGQITDSTTGMTISGGGAKKALTIGGDLTVNGNWNAGAILDKGDSNGGANQRSTYPVSINRYVVTALDKGTAPTTVPLDDKLLLSLCQDEDGCTVTLGMRNWSPETGVYANGILATVGPFRFSINPAVSNKRWWDARNQTANGPPSNPLDSNVVASAQDGDGVLSHIARSGDCFFTDGEYINSQGTDNKLGFGLLNWSGQYNSTDMTCVLIIED